MLYRIVMQLKKKKKSTEKIQLLCHAFGFIFENVIVVSILRN